MSKVYYNTNTGEITESHKEAMSWFRAGDDVDILRDGIRAMGWIH